MTIAADPIERTGVDAITAEVIGSALASIAEEMGETLVRSAYSTNIKERRDCSTALFDTRGRTIVQAEHIPIHLGSLIGVIGEIAARYPAAEIADGDAFLANDAYAGGGTHLPDVVLATPIFVDGRLTAWAANVAHHADFVDRGHDHIFQEGLRIPPIRLQRAGVVQTDVLELILHNCQVPRERRLDLMAQFAANRLGVQRYQEVCAKYGADVVTAVCDAQLDYAERRLRAGIASIPDGVYRFSDRFDSEELDEELTLGVSVRVDGDSITLDFTENPDQVRAGLNMVYTALLATVYYAVKTVTDPDAPSNAGIYRAISVVARPGSILSSVAPAAVNSRTNTCQRVVDVILGALAQAVPERVVAACNGANTAITFSGVDPRSGSYYVYQETLGGGFGARATKDGIDGVQVHITNTSNLPIEALETEYPLVVEEYALEPDSGGAGRWRGGMGIRRRIRVVDHDAVVCVSSTRRLSSPWGLAGGHPGGRCRVELDAGVAPLVKGAGVLHAGQWVGVVTPGAGGYGPPRDRVADAVASDLAEGRISTATAALHAADGAADATVEHP